ncbi:hypothetical protein QFZ53_001473 [Microbacterium natoriense]|uniref:META domain-containing protein n=1 Tax=Microbacterium natoriense TaxID=284570 RepID=A0AAW8EW26_9MICO|nr:hypothetical protein [Microbacterium natoriense]MDQ0647277.1 hypothetical protein [Microbacterium natoriense]
MILADASEGTARVEWTDKASHSWTLVKNEPDWVLEGNVCGELRVILTRGEDRTVSVASSSSDASCADVSAEAREWTEMIFSDPASRWEYDQGFLTIHTNERQLSFDRSDRD